MREHVGEHATYGGDSGADAIPEPAGATPARPVTRSPTTRRPGRLARLHTASRLRRGMPRTDKRGRRQANRRRARSSASRLPLIVADEHYSDEELDRFVADARNLLDS